MKKLTFAFVGLWVATLHAAGDKRVPVPSWAVDMDECKEEIKSIEQTWKEKVKIPLKIKCDTYLRLSGSNHFAGALVFTYSADLVGVIEPFRHLGKLVTKDVSITKTASRLIIDLQDRIREVEETLIEVQRKTVVEDMSMRFCIFDEGIKMIEDFAWGRAAEIAQKRKAEVKPVVLLHDCNFKSNGDALVQGYVFYQIQNEMK